MESNSLSAINHFEKMNGLDITSDEEYYKAYRTVLQRVKDDLHTLKDIGSDYAVFQSAQYAARVIKRASKDIDKI